MSQGYEIFYRVHSDAIKSTEWTADDGRAMTSFYQDATCEVRLDGVPVLMGPVKLRLSGSSAGVPVGLYRPSVDFLEIIKGSLSVKRLHSLEMVG